jgi:hypothetical protein
MNNTIIVTRHHFLVEWLANKGITGKVIAHATPDDVLEKHVIGVLPFNLAALAIDVTTVDMPNLRSDQRGMDITPMEMDVAGATMATYVVMKI